MELIFLGTIVGLKGLDGTLKVATDEDILPKQNAKVKVGYSVKYSQEFTILDYKITNSKYNYLKLVEINGIEEAKKLIEMGVYLSEDDIIVDNTKKDYPNELGYSVIDFKTGEEIGIAVEIVPNPGNDLILVKTESGEFFIPFVDVFVKSFDEKEKKILVELLDGMI